MCVVEYGPQVLFCFKASDKGMRNVAVVAVTDAKVAVKDAAVVFGLTPEYVSELRGRARKEGSAGLVKAMGRPPMLSPRQVVKVRERAGQGATKTALAKQFKVSRPVIADVLARHGVIAAQPALADDLPGDDHLIEIFRALAFALSVIPRTGHAPKLRAIFRADSRLLPFDVERVACFPERHDGRYDDAAWHQMRIQPL